MLMSQLLRYLFLMCVCWLSSCAQQLPEERLLPFPWQPRQGIAGDTIWVEVPNAVAAPLRVYLRTEVPALREALAAFPPWHIVAPGDTLRLRLPRPEGIDLPPQPIRAGANLGDPQLTHPDSRVRYRFPFPLDKTYQVLQGYHGQFSHQEGVSTYAIDFDLAMGDTVCAARDGVVVGLIDGYTIGGPDAKFRPFANSINLYQADGTVAQYTHLAPHSALVALGDSVHAGQPLATVGLTGFTDGPHLHFCVIAVDSTGTDRGVPVRFGQTAGATLKRGMEVRHAVPYGRP